MSTAVALLIAALVVAIVGLWVADRVTSDPEAWNRFKGRWGEWRVRLFQLRKLDPKLYHSHHGVYLPRTTSEGITEVDHIVVSPYGVFVIETKNRSGWIRGGPSDESWTVTYGRHAPRTMYNPLRQNEGHAQAVTAFLGIERRAIHPLVVLVGDSQTMSSMGPDVIIGEGLIERITAHSTRILDAETVRECNEKLRRHNRNPQRRRARRQHKTQTRIEELMRDRRQANRRRWQPPVVASAGPGRAQPDARTS